MSIEPEPSEHVPTDPNPKQAKDVGDVRVSRTATAWTLTLSNPGRRNALTWHMYGRLREELTTLTTMTAQGSPRVLILQGDGNAFAAGTDIRQFQAFTSGQDGIDYEQQISDVLRLLGDVPIPVLAVVRGPAVGGGLGLVAFSDIVIASEDAQFGAPIARTLGNILAPTVLDRLRSRISHAHLTRVLLTSELLSADEAHAAGLVTQVVTDSDIEAAVERNVGRIASAAPLTLRGLKEIQRRLDAQQALPDADDVIADVYGSADFAEGVTAFVEKRRAQWQGA